jgi:hypothetical protein
MGKEALVAEQIEAGTRFLREFQKYAPIRDAFWVKRTEDGPWYLYIVPEQFTDKDIDRGYKEVVRIIHALRDPWFSPLWVTLIGVKDPVAKAVAELQRLHPGRVPLRFYDRSLGGEHVEEGYVYPPGIAAPAQSVGKAQEADARQGARED